MEGRYLKNTSPDYSGSLPNSQLIYSTIRDLVDKLAQDYPPSADYQIDSKGQKSPKFTIYTGSGGNLWLYYQLNKKLGTEFEESLREALNSNLRAAAPGKISFLNGRSGIHALAAVVTQESWHIEKVLEDQHLIPHSESELLFGLAGYIYSLVFILKHWPDNPYTSALTEALEYTCAELVSRGGGPPLRFEWHGKKYLGAAHGSVGIIHMLLQARPFLISNYDNYIRTTIDYVLSLSLASGNIPSSEGKNTDLLLQFCHGATGAVPMLLKASVAFDSQEYLTAALRMGNLIWAKGLLKKGLGLCHGVAGSGYALLCLYRQTRDKLWLYRAMMFALKICGDTQLHTEVKSFDDRTKAVSGVPDRPYSLFEGIGGTLCFLVDVTYPQNAGFPCYDL